MNEKVHGERHMQEKQKVLAENYSFWPHLTEEEKNRLTENCMAKTYEKGEVIHRSEEQCKGAILLLDGQLRVYIVSEEGREITLFRIRAGESCVMSASCLLDSIAFDMMIEATQKTEALIIPVHVLHPVMEQNPYVGLYLYKEATERFSDVMWTMQQILFMGIDQRVAHFLWDESLHQGQEIAMTHDEIARYIGSAREVVSKVLKYLAEEGIVSLGRGKIRILDKKKLKELL